MTDAYMPEDRPYVLVGPSGIPMPVSREVAEAFIAQQETDARTMAAAFDRAILAAIEEAE